MIGVVFEVTSPSGGDVMTSSGACVLAVRVCAIPPVGQTMKANTIAAHGTTKDCFVTVQASFANLWFA
jgi:hypothetical protein